MTVTANAKPGYAFLGWYRTIDGQLQLVSQEQTYAYTVGKQGVQTVYARFARTYTITYAWDERTTDPRTRPCPHKTPQRRERLIRFPRPLCRSRRQFPPR